MMMKSFEKNSTAVVIGANGGIGTAFVEQLSDSDQIGTIIAYSRGGTSFQSDKVTARELDFLNEDALSREADFLKTKAPRLILVATGVLHNGALQPEKTWRQLNAKQMEAVFRVNTFGPALALRYFLPLLPREGKSAFAAISARVGSISDNGIGGWYSYRASKAALNMMIRTASIELGRRWKEAVCVGLHPGTVDTDLSEPFQGNVAEGKLFTPAYSATKMLDVLDGLSAKDSGLVFDYAGKQVPF